MYVVSSKQMYKNVFDWAVSSNYQKGNTMHSYEHHTVYILLSQ